MVLRKSEQCLPSCSILRELSTACLEDPCLFIGDNCVGRSPPGMSCEDFCCDVSTVRLGELAGMAVLLLLILVILLARLLRVRRRRLQAELAKQESSAAGDELDVVRY